jgi:AraC-like DNA-binding protein
MLPRDAPATISMRYAERILATAEAAAVPRSELLHAAPLETIDRFGDPRITAQAYYALWGAAMERVGDPAFPLRVAASTGIETYEVFGFAIMTSSTFRAGLEAASRYLKIWTDLATWDLSVSGKTAKLRLIPSPVRHRASRYAATCALAEVLHTSRAYLGVSWTPAEVQVSWRDTDDHEELRRFFGAPVTAVRSHPALVFDASLLDLPFAKADPMMASFFVTYAEKLLERAPDATDLVAAVQQHIGQMLQSGTPTLDAVGKQLAMSTRTLRRRLADEGHTFAQLLQDTRRSLAKQHLEDDRLTIAEIGFVLGFSDVSAFHRSFRRWTGMTPAGYRGRRR